MLRKLFALLLAITMVSIPFYTPVGVSAAPSPGNPELSRSIGPEGMVLLKNDSQTLPLKAGAKVTLFGQSKNYIKGGTGSGDVNVSYVRSIFYGMDLKSQAGKIALNPTTYPSAGNGYSVTADEVTAARSVSDKAIIVINRNSGEGGDRSSGAGDYQLSSAETTMLQLVTAGFEDVVVVLNIGGIMDLSWVKNYPQIKSVLLTWQAGMEGGNAVADVLVGDAYPSGKLVDTFAENYNYYPSSSASGIGTFGGTGDVYYGEDIYVGYQYFATADPTYSKVTYEFGYGLGYTPFNVTPTIYDTVPTGGNNGQVPVSGGNINVSATVKNTGATYSGKEVVQVYYQGPDGELNKAARELAAFKKTSELAPGAEQTLSLSFPVNEMASYDDQGKTGKKACWVLEPGRYKIYVGNSVKNAVYVGYHEVAALTVTEECHTYLTPNTGFDILVDPVNDEFERIGPPAPIAIHSISGTKTTNFNADKPSSKSKDITYVVGASSGMASVTGFVTGNWISYTVNVETAGDYYFSYNFSNGNAAVANSFDIFIDDVATRLNQSNMDMFNTSTSSMYQQRDSSEFLISLPEGEHVLTLKANSDPNGYLYFLTFRPSWVAVGEHTISAEKMTQIKITECFDKYFTGNATFELIPDGSGEKCIGAFNTGSWTTYKIAVEEAGEYQLVLDYANGNTAMTDSIRLYTSPTVPVGSNYGTRLTTTPSVISIAQTASSGSLRYYTFVDSEVYSVDLAAGTYYFTVVSNAGSAGNVRSFKFRPAAFLIRNSGTTLINAYEYTTKTSSITIETASTTGTPTIANFNNGQVLTYNLNVQTGGAYKFQLNYANGRAAIPDPFTITVGSTVQNVQVRMEQTGDGSGSGQWYNPRLSDVYLIDLPTGAVTLTFTSKSTSGNLNYFTLRPNVLPDGLYDISATDSVRVSIYPPNSTVGNARFENIPGTSEQCIGNFDAGVRLNYLLNVAAGGTYTMVFDYANGNATNNNALNIYVNNVNQNITINFPQIVQGGWYNFANSAAYEITLPAGSAVPFGIESRVQSASNIRSIYFMPKSVVMGYSYDPSDHTPKYNTDPDNSIFKPVVGDEKLSDILDENGKYTEADLDKFIEKFTLDEMAYLSGGHGAGIPSGTGTLGGLARLGVPALETADGPAGLRIDSATAWPIGTMLACTWNTELIEKMGEAVGDEMVLNQVDIWLAPGMNIHRNPLCGRNFEYYSEDPLLTGKIAAALTRGVQTRDVGVTLKHYAFNNQEQARNDGSNSVLTERAAREIYLKGFEIACKEADPFCIMSSYNYMNGTETAERWDLITGIPTGEWGWRGIMMTDWGNGSNNAREAAAGNDIKMSSGSVSTITSAVTAGTLTIEQLRENMKDILITTLRSRKQHQESVINVTPVPAIGKIRIEAEDFNEAGAATDGQVPQNEGCSDTGGGRNVGYMNTGGSMTYFVDVARAGTYNFTFRYAGNSGSGGRLEIFEDNISTGKTAQLTNTAGWQNWATLDSIQVPLTAGEHRLKIYIANGGCNINWFDIERVLTPDISTSPDYQIYQLAADIGDGKFSPEFAIIRNAGTGSATLYAAVYDSNGKLLGMDLTPVSADSTNFTMAVASLSKPDSGAASYKFFIWDGGFRPLTNLTTIN